MIQVIKVTQVVQLVWVVQVVKVVQVARMISLEPMHSENIWFKWSLPSNYQEKLRCHVCDKQTEGERKVEDR